MSNTAGATRQAPEIPEEDINKQVEVIESSWCGNVDSGKHHVQEVNTPNGSGVITEAVAERLQDEYDVHPGEFHLTVVESDE